MDVTALATRIAGFEASPPHLVAPYLSRAWGHPLHSLCSYQGKLKPALAHWLIERFLDKDASLLDPLGGVGTIPFEAALAGHRAVSNDKSPFAALVAAAKLDPPSMEEATKALHGIEERMKSALIDDSDFEAAEFGLNSPVSSYYHETTLEEVLRARRVFLSEGWGDRGERFAWASLLHVLHGNRPYALSRTSHPMTPFAPTGDFEYRPLVQRVARRMTAALAADMPPSFRPGTGLHGDFRSLPDVIEPVDAIVTSPPFIGMRFDRPNWLRMWFCGWGEQDFHKQSLGFLEREQVRSTECYSEFFAVCGAVTRPKALLVVHVGSGGRGDLVGTIREGATASGFAQVGEVIEDVAHHERHGLKDKGLTKAHHLLFFRRKR